MTGYWRELSAVLVWPGAVSAALLGWLFLWIARKLTARVQGRKGPPFYQPFFDFAKLLGKRTVVPVGVNRRYLYGLPLAAVVSVVLATALIPAPGSAAPSFAGDLILLLYLLEVPALCQVLAGYQSRSPYGEVGAMREALLWLGYNLPFLAATLALAARARSFNLQVIAAQPLGPVHLAAALAFLVALPARLRTNPFSIPNAEQEILAGALTEYSGPPLALFELAHALEVAALAGLFAALFLPVQRAGPWGPALYVLGSVVVVTIVTLVAAATARLKVQQAFRFYWAWGGLAALVALATAIL